MNKFIRFSFWLIFIISALILALAFIEPKDAYVTRTVVINAPKRPLFEQLVQFPNWNNWSTLLSVDTTASITYTGAQGQPGSTLDWKGDDGKIGSGTIRNEGVDSTTLHYSFTVTKPASWEADGTISVTDTGDYAKVTWTFHKHFPFLANAILIVFDLEKYMGTDMERSLSNLKRYIETGAEPLVDIREVQYPGGLVAGIRDTMQWNEMQTFFGDTYSLFSNAPADKMTGPPIGIFYDWDTLNHKADIFAGIPVSGTDIPVNGITFSEIQPSRAFKVTYKGSYENSEAIHKALDKHIASKGLTKWLTIEEYIMYPANEKDSHKFVTNIYALVQ
jgi:effector-binding domain-containing protein